MIILNAYQRMLLQLVGRDLDQIDMDNARERFGHLFPYSGPKKMMFISTPQHEGNNLFINKQGR